jgi:DNA-directed RNA polymerase
MVFVKEVSNKVIFMDEGEIIEIGKDPLNNKWWMEADKPWLFLRACIEMFNYYTTSDLSEFISYLPVTVDGSCNGLQHFSAILRDEIGAKAVNLIPSDEPEDVYEIVKEKVAEKVRTDPEAIVAPSDISRALVKRPVMTTPYGATLYGMREQIYEELKKQLDKGVVFTTISKDKDLWVYCRYLAKLIYEAIGEVVVSARENGAKDDEVGISLFLVPLALEGVTCIDHRNVAGGQQQFDGCCPEVDDPIRDDPIRDVPGNIPGEN